MGASRALPRAARLLDRRLPVTAKLAVPLLFGLGTWVAIAMFLVGFPTLRAEILRAEERRALTIATLVESAYETSSDPSALHGFLDKAILRDPTMLLIRIYRAENGVPVTFASSDDPAAIGHPPEANDLAPLETGTTEQHFESQRGRELLETVVPLRSLGQPPAAVGVYTLLDPLNRAIERLSSDIAIVAAIGLTMQTITVLFVVRAIVLRPIQRIDRAAARVAAGDLTVRLMEEGAPRTVDEIARVSSAFDRMTRAVAEERAAIERAAETDGLTGLLNRRALDVRLERELAQAKRLGYPLAFSLVDLDRFKKLNDTRGHLAGDDALRRVADALLIAVRRTDIVARYGGDEFAVIHPGCDLANAAVVADRIRAAIAGLGIPTVPSGPERLTTSVGTALLREADTVDTLIGEADRSLYAAKREAGPVEVAARV